MKIKSLASFASGSENTRDRYLAVRKSWSNEEREFRRKVALESQLRLASLIELDERKSIRVNDFLLLAACN